MKSEAVLVRKLAVGGIVSLLLLAGCGGGANQPASSGSNPTPTITTISPNSTVAGGAAFTLNISGTNFVAASVVNFGGSAVATTFVNSTQLTATIPAASIAATGTPAVTVTNPTPGGGTSKAINFTITSAVGSVPTILALFPSSVPAGEPSFQLQVVGPNPGSNFLTGSVVRWNGSARPTTSDAVNGLVAQISASDIAAAGTAAVTVFNPGAGGGSSNALTFTITTGSVDPQSIALDPTGKFAYVMDGGSDGDGGYVSMYTINPTTGALASIGPPVPTNGYGVYYGSGINAGSVAVDPLGKFAYVTNSGDVWDYDDEADGTVTMYAINATTGALTSTGTIYGNCPGLCLPSSVVVDPSGKFAYVPNGGGGAPFNVAMYTINSTTGALTSIGTVAAGTDPLSVAVDPAGNFAYVANWTGYDTDGSVSMYTIDATTGALTFIGSITAGIDPVSIAVDPAGKFAYVANWTVYDADGSVSMYTIDATTGSLTPIGTIATEIAPTSIAIHPSGKFAYVTNSGSNSVSMYSIDSATGTLTLIGTIGT